MCHSLIGKHERTCWSLPNETLSWTAILSRLLISSMPPPDSLAWLLHVHLVSAVHVPCLYSADRPDMCSWFFSIAALKTTSLCLFLLTALNLSLQHIQDQPLPPNILLAHLKWLFSQPLPSMAASSILSLRRSKTTSWWACTARMECD